MKLITLWLNIRRLEQRTNEEKIPSVVKAALTLGQLGDARAVEPLIRARTDGGSYDEVYEAVTMALGQLRDKRATAAVLRGLRSTHRCRIIAIQALGQIGDLESVPLLVECLDEPNLGGVEDAIQALSRFPAAQALPLLLPYLEDKRGNIYEGIAQVLGNLGDRRAVEPLCASLRNNFLSKWHLPLAANTALGRLGDKRAVPFLIAQLADPGTNTRMTAAKALASLGETTWQECIKGDDGDIDRLCATGDQRVISAVIRTLGSPDAKMRQQCAQRVAGLGEPQWQQWVKGESDDWIRLGRSGEPRALEPLIEALHESHLHSDVVAEAARGLAELGDPAAIPLLNRKVETKWLSDDAHRAVVNALAVVGHAKP